MPGRTVSQGLLAALLSTICGGGGFAADQTALGFTYCPPPVIPSCIERSARVKDRRELDACSRDVLRFTQTLGTYRACLTRESERAIGTGNDAIARFRCMSQHGGSCP